MPATQIAGSIISFLRTCFSLAVFSSSFLAFYYQATGRSRTLTRINLAPILNTLRVLSPLSSESQSHFLFRFDLCLLMRALKDRDRKSEAHYNY